MHLSTFLQFEYFTDCSIREYRSILDELRKHLPIMLALCQHNTLAYYAFYYAGIFDAGLCGMEAVCLMNRKTNEALLCKALGDNADPIRIA